MNKAQLVDAVAERLGSRRQAHEAVDAVLATLTQALAAGEQVAITGFATFENIERAAGHAPCADC